MPAQQRVDAPSKRALSKCLFLARRPLSLWVCALVLLPLAVHAQIDILTNRYDAARTGANLAGNDTDGGERHCREIRQALLVPRRRLGLRAAPVCSGLTINGAVRDVLYVATMKDRVYAFDARQASQTPLWTRNFTSPPSITPVPITDIVGPDLNIVGNVGIQGTPVIDQASGTMYLVARTKESGAYVQRLHALDIATGRGEAGSPVTITASVPGTAPRLDGRYAADGSITFDPKMHVQRAGLALVNGVVLVSWAAHEDATPRHGWIMGFDAATLARVAAFAVTPDVYGGGIWQGGRAPPIDAGGQRLLRDRERHNGMAPAISATRC